jgi:hypothetical protein
LAWACVACGAALALALRHGLVEPAELTARCDALVWDARVVSWAWLGQDGVCLARTLTVQAFIQHRLAGLAMALACLALLSRWRCLAGLALMAGAAAMVLYAADVGALALMLAAWAWLLPRQGRDAA